MSVLTAEIPSKGFWLVLSLPLLKLLLFSFKKGIYVYLSTGKLSGIHMLIPAIASWKHLFGVGFVSLYATEVLAT